MATKTSASKASNSKAAATPYKTRIDLSEQKRHKLIALLNQSLADTFDLFSQTKQAHWNVKGKDFYQLHLLYDDLAEKLEEPADLLAERVALLGGYARGTVRMAAKDSRITGFPGLDDKDVDPNYLETLADRWAEYAQHIREDSLKADDLEDPGTADLYDQITHVADRGLWFIEAHVQRYHGGLPGGGADPTT